MPRLEEANTLLGLLNVGDPKQAAIRVPGGPDITYSSLATQVAELAAELKKFGIRRGDRVASSLPNSAEGIITFLASATAGVAAPLNPAYKADEFQFYLEDTTAQMLITSAEGGDTEASVRPEGVPHVIAKIDAQGVVRFETQIAQEGERSLDGLAEADDVALILHTSGTTSRPKRVPLKHRNLLASVTNIIATYGLTSNDVSLCIMPLFHVHGLLASTLATLGSGGTVVVPERFNPLNFWPLVKDYGVTWFTAVPTMHNALLARARSGGSRQDASLYRGLRFIRSCSAPLSPATMQEMEDRFGAPVVEAYGMTEASHQMSSNPLPPGERLAGSVGIATGVDVGIMDEDGNLLSSGETGEIVVKGLNVIDGYEDNPDANATSFVNGWFRTGDQGILAEDGYLRLVGRIKELINRSGEKIAPAEIDDVLSAHPSVKEAVAFGVPHPTHGEEPSAAVVLAGEITEGDLIKHCKEHLADFKVPRTIHIVDEIPRTATGKVQRRIVAAVVTEQSVKV
ncbi:MAG: acyl--CoA ligase [Chloroflexota bacterium]|nr:acyl--CoA ligase [Chloroflexota bacterium]